MDIVPGMLYVLLTALNVCAVQHQDRPIPEPEPLVAPDALRFHGFHA